MRALLVLAILSGCGATTLQNHPATISSLSGHTPEEIVACVREAWSFGVHPYTVVKTGKGQEIRYATALFITLDRGPPTVVNMYKTNLSGLAPIKRRAQAVKDCL